LPDYPPIQIVDENDKPIGEASMIDAYDKGLIHRVVYIAVEDESGKLLLQKRGPTLINFPNCWDISAAGHVDAEEEYVQAAKRELSEELGINNVILTEIGSYYREVHLHNRLLKRFNKAYKAIIPYNAQITPHPIETTEVKWLELGAVKRLIAENPDEAALGLTDFIEKYYQHEDN
jgi:isopentenyldiphosphate isomerase